MEKLSFVMNKASNYGFEELPNLVQLVLYEFHFNNTTRCKNMHLNENKTR